MTVFLIILAALIVIFIIATYIAFNFGFKRNKNSASMKPMKGLKPTIDKMMTMRETMIAEKEWFLANVTDRISITSFDSLTLQADVMRCDNARCTILLMHGYRSTGIRDFAISLRFYHELGCNIILPDQRACGSSEGKYITFGAKERYDCRDWCVKARELFGDTPLILGGLSLGAATVLMASGLELPENVKGIIADCGFTSPADEIGHVAREFFHLPSAPAVAITNVYTRLLAKFSLYEASAPEALKSNRLPVLFIHGGDDNFVPTRMTHENHASCTSRKQLYIGDGAGHAMTYMLHTDTYRELVRDFIAENTEEA